MSPSPPIPPPQLSIPPPMSPSIPLRLTAPVAPRSGPPGSCWCVTEPLPPPAVCCPAVPPACTWLQPAATKPGGSVNGCWNGMRASRSGRCTPPRWSEPTRPPRPAPRLWGSRCRSSRACWSARWGRGPAAASASSRPCRRGERCSPRPRPSASPPGRVPPSGRPPCSSPLERAPETAEASAQALGLPVQIEPSLLECEVGEWTGRSLSELSALPEWRTVQSSPSTFRFPGGESFLEMQDRMVATMDRLRSAHPGGTVVCFSHADPIRSLLAHALGGPLDSMQRLSVSPCSVSAVLYRDAGNPVVLLTNSSSQSLAELTAQ